MKLQERPMKQGVMTSYIWEVLNLSLCSVSFPKNVDIGEYQTKEKHASFVCTMSLCPFSFSVTLIKFTPMLG